MKNFVQSAPWSVAVLTLVAGCNSKDEKPRGAGASGRSFAVLPKPQLYMEKLFTYTQDQEKVLALMNRPFGEAVKETGAATDRAAKDILEKVSAGWDALPFVRKKEGLKARYRLQFDTSAG